MPPKKKADPKLMENLQDMANMLRIHCVECTSQANSGHPTSCSSCAEIMSVLFFHIMRYKLTAPKDPSSDRLILSKGHAAPILYAAWAEAGLFGVSELKNLRKLPYDLEGCPTPRLSFVDVCTGSLGQGLAVACGMAYVGKYLDKATYRTYCLLGDGESSEGSVWEAMAFASHYKLDNLCVIIDVNRLGYSEATPLAHDMEAYSKRVDAFGVNPIIVDGHNCEELTDAFGKARHMREKPSAILAKTFKGKNFPEIEDSETWHAKPLGEKTESVIKHLKSLIQFDGALRMSHREPTNMDAPCVTIKGVRMICAPSYKLGENVSTRNAFGSALYKMAKCNPRVIALDGDVKTETGTDRVKQFDSSKLLECFIAEQNLVGVAIGLACRDRCVPFVSTYGAFLTRAFDQIRVGAISQTNVNIVGSHCGVSVGEDGPSYMAMEDIAMFRVVPGSTIFYPADAVSCERAIELAANTEGICYIRTTLPETPVIYQNQESFQIGKAKVIKKSKNDTILVIGGGITIHEIIAASVELDKMGIFIRIMDLFTIKPIDKKSIVQHAKECKSMIITVEDHYPQGGLGEAVLAACAMAPDILVKIIAVPKVPRSGKCADLLNYYGISADHIISACRQSCYCSEND